MTDMIAGGAGATEDLIKSADLKSFGEDVIVASREVPVIVDFWADWCGPCKQLMPALEAAVKAAGGKVRLVKVNADENQALCGQLQVQSLPTVLAFWQGQPVDGFQGAIPPSQLNVFIDRLTKLAGEGGAPANDDEAMIAEALAHADELLAAGEAMQAVQIYQQILGHDDKNAGALVGLADAAVKLGKADQVQEILNQVPEDALKDAKLADRVSGIKTVLELAEQAKGLASPVEYEAMIAEDPQNHQARYDLSLAEAARGNMDGAADALLGIIMRDREWQDDAARKQLLKLFEAAGPTDPFTVKYRRRLSSVLFS
ncbi:tetratricopeptide repeat protein [Kordiimonas marina]|uniref:tetratricopeptide repeat protein n=1 Tax=Kordiimonas marina TaxID=2872312 RepID=UPI001FF1D69F|nr:tetratricopeptide repeat protein [Kordiimonas marina]MCJ9428167.1 tetratricopeptide repeat protein [Kordiimonas marina]